jgi:hypothetical protein
VDAADIAVWFLAAIAFGGAVWETSREKKEEDLTKAMFPEE